MLKLSNYKNERDAIDWAGQHWAYGNVAHYASLALLLGAVLAALVGATCWAFCSLALSAALRAVWGFETERALGIWRLLADAAEREFLNEQARMPSDVLQNMVRDHQLGQRVRDAARDELARRKTGPN